ncbi:MAG: xylulokinase [Actinobacteria bacterium]|nr:xylulokinase [Actinomycetota bacterium]
MRFLLGLDVGTTSTRTIIIDENGKLIASSTSDYKLITPKPGWAEQIPDDWWTASVKTIKDVIKKSNVSPEDINCIGLSGQMHGSVFLDSTGDVIRPAILWCDQRTCKQCETIYKIFSYDGFIKLSYNRALPGFTAPKILWLKENEPENYKKVSKILLPKDYIRYKLSNNYATEVSDASGTILMNIPLRNWSDEILDGLKIKKSLLPEVFESDVISTKVSSEASHLTGLTQGTPIVGGGSDNAAGAVGSGIVKSGLISDSIGTSGVVFAHSDKPLYDPQGRVHSFCHAVPGKWHLTAVTLSAAGSLKWYYEKFGPSREIIKSFPYDKGYDLLNKQVERVAVGSDGLIFLPYLSGERTPYSDPNARGVFFGISYLHGPDHFARSIMEGVAFSQLDCLSLIRELNINSDRIILFGGGARSGIWRQIIADILNSKVVTLNVEEGSAFGAAIIAGAGCGIYSSIEEGVNKIIREDNENNPIAENVEKYKKLYTIYKSLYTDLKDNFKKLSKL